MLLALAPRVRGVELQDLAVELAPGRGERWQLAQLRGERVVWRSGRVDDLGHAPPVVRDMLAAREVRPDWAQVAWRTPASDQLYDLRHTIYVPGLPEREWLSLPRHRLDGVRIAPLAHLRREAPRVGTLAKDLLVHARVWGLMVAPNLDVCGEPPSEHDDPPDASPPPGPWRLHAGLGPGLTIAERVAAGEAILALTRAAWPDTIWLQDVSVADGYRIKVVSEGQGVKVLRSRPARWLAEEAPVHLAGLDLTHVAEDLLLDPDDPPQLLARVAPYRTPEEVPPLRLDLPGHPFHGFRLEAAPRVPQAQWDKKSWKKPPPEGRTALLAALESELYGVNRLISPTTRRTTVLTP